MHRSVYIIDWSVNSANISHFCQCLHVYLQIAGHRFVGMCPFLIGCLFYAIATSKAIPGWVLIYDCALMVTF